MKKIIFCSFAILFGGFFLGCSSKPISIPAILSGPQNETSSLPGGNFIEWSQNLLYS
jgi:hypothetical protein